MRVQLFVASCTLALAAGRSAMLAAPGQTQTPGQMTQARVWIENRGRQEALPVSLQEVAPDTPPMRVRVINGVTPSGSDDPVNVHVVRQPAIWQYQSVTIKGGEDMAAALSASGAAGWEATGVAVTNADGTTLLMKRLR